MPNSKTQSTSTRSLTPDQLGQPWLKRRDESAKAYAALTVYLELGAERSINAVVQRQRRKSRRPLGKWSSLHDWVSRAEAYDVWLTQIRLDAAERAAKQDAEQWAQRHREFRERQYRLGQAMLDQVETMVKFPITKVTRTVQADGDGRPVQVQKFEAALWFKRDIAPLGTFATTLTKDAIRNEGAPTTEVVETDTYNLVPFKPEGKK
jgi:hypothetical protein